MNSPKDIHQESRNPHRPRTDRPRSNGGTSSRDIKGGMTQMDPPRHDAMRTPGPSMIKDRARSHQGDPNEGGSLHFRRRGQAERVERGEASRMCLRDGKQKGSTPGCCVGKNKPEAYPFPNAPGEDGSLDNRDETGRGQELHDRRSEGNRRRNPFQGRRLLRGLRPRDGADRPQGAMRRRRPARSIARNAAPKQSSRTSQTCLEGGLIKKSS